MPPPPLRDSFPYSIPHQFRATWQLFCVPVPLNPAGISPSPPVPPSKLMITRNGYPPVLSIEHLSFMQKLHCFEVMTDEQRGYIAFLHTTCEDIVIFTIFIIQSSWCDLFCISSPLFNITPAPWEAPFSWYSSCSLETDFTYFHQTYTRTPATLC